jgi:hypothetical protein
LTSNLARSPGERPEERRTRGARTRPAVDRSAAGHPHRSVGPASQPLLAIPSPMAREGQQQLSVHPDPVARLVPREWLRPGRRCRRRRDPRAPDPARASAFGGHDRARRGCVATRHAGLRPPRRPEDHPSLRPLPTCDEPPRDPRHRPLPRRRRRKSWSAVRSCGLPRTALRKTTVSMRDCFGRCRTSAMVARRRRWVSCGGA